MGNLSPQLTDLQSSRRWRKQKKPSPSASHWAFRQCSRLAKSKWEPKDYSASVTVLFQSLFLVSLVYFNTFFHW